MSFNKVSVIGLGYIGLPTAAVIAGRKTRVIGVDINKNTIETINKGEVHIVEPDLDIIVRAAVKEGYLYATDIPEPADVFLIAVPTPFKKIANDYNCFEPDLTFIEKAAKAIAKVIKKNDLIILESTSPVGTTEKLAEWLSTERPDLSFPHQQGEYADINIGHCPERVLPGHIIRELVENDRVIGGMTNACSARCKEFYRLFVEGECVITNVRTAEMVKLAENSFRDVNIAYANEISIICEKIDVDVWELISLANRHPRVDILKPSVGVGGHCIAVDPWFIVSQSPDDSVLIRTAREVNDKKPHWVVEKIRSELNNFILKNPGMTLADISITCYGLAFKPNVDDLRESPAVKVVKQLSVLTESTIRVVEPNISELSSEFDVNIELVKMTEGVDLGDIHVVLVGHKEFSQLEKLVADLNKNIIQKIC